MAKGGGRVALGGVVFAAAFLGQPATTVLEPGAVTERNVAPGEVHRYPLDLADSRVLRMTVAQRPPFTLTARLIAGDGRTVSECSGRHALLFSAKVDAAGHYLLEVSGNNDRGARSGHYTIGPVEI